MTAPGTATREEFERLVGALAWAAYREANPYVPDGSAKTDAARASLLRYEERLRGERDRLRAACERIAADDYCAEEHATRQRCAQRYPKGDIACAFCIARAALGVPASAADVP